MRSTSHVISSLSSVTRSVSASSNSLLKGLPNRLHQFVPQFSIFATYYCSFLLNVTANLVCISLVSRQLVLLLSPLPKFLHPLCGQKRVSGCSSKNFHFDWCQSLLSFFLTVQISFHIKEWREPVHNFFENINENIVKHYKTL